MKKNHNSNIAREYDKYYHSGLYDNRYPTYNPHVMAYIRKSLLQNTINDYKKIVDYGCGEGRYLIELAKQKNHEVVGYDISREAIKNLSNHLNTRFGHLHNTFLFSNEESFLSFLEENKPFSCITILFGVLSHIGSKTERIETLIKMKNVLTRNTGVIILSVPNRNRRFLIKQFKNILKNRAFKKSEDIAYKRQSTHGDISLFYHLYSLSTLQEEVSQAGLVIQHISAESIFPEKWVLSSRFFSYLDRLLARCLPLSCAYGFLVSLKEQESTSCSR